MEIMHTAIVEDELEVFKSLPYVKVVFDIGARDDVDYLIIKPNIELHAFEPNPLFFSQLTENVGDMPKAHLNQFGLGEKEGTYAYNHQLQSTGAEHESGILIRRLDDYVEENNIKRIDFLKMDTEGSELGIIKGGKETIGMCRYIQYERNPNAEEIDKMLLEKNYILKYIGGSNTIAIRKGEQMPWIPERPEEGGLKLKTEKNYLRPWS